MKYNSHTKLVFILIIVFIQFQQIIYAQFAYKKDILYKTVNDNDSISKKFCKLDIVYNPNVKNSPTLIFIHGGGLTSGDKYFPPIFRDKSYIVISPDYRLSPVSKCPSYIDDVAAAVAWTFRHVKEFGGSEKNIYLMGYSSGAYLASMLFLNKEYLLKYNIDPDSLAGFFLLSGQMTTHFQVMFERGIKVGSNNILIDEFAPLKHIRRTIPPAIFFTGDSIMDMAGRYVQNKKITFLLDSLGNKNIEFIELKGKDHNTFIDSAMIISMKRIDFFEQSRSPSSNKTIERLENNIRIEDNNLKIYTNDTILKSNIYNVEGKKILSNLLENIIDISSLNNGLFLINIQTNSNSITSKFLISKR